MRHAIRPITTATLAALLLIAGPALAADPANAIFWSAETTARIMRDAAAKVNKDTGMSPQRFGDSMFLMHREKTSGAEAHMENADYIIINGGAGTILVGGTILNGKLDRPGEIRGDAIEGGNPILVKAGDALYVPKAMPHQFQVPPGGHLVYTVVKVTPAS
jgi:mannose-6-phosphate isomerase-like protein (cupin superfamily)